MTIAKHFQRALHWALILSFNIVLLAMLANWPNIIWTGVAVFFVAAGLLLMSRRRRSRERVEQKLDADDSGSECGWPDDTYTTPGVGR